MGKLLGRIPASQVHKAPGWCLPQVEPDNIEDNKIFKLTADISLSGRKQRTRRNRKSVSKLPKNRSGSSVVSKVEANEASSSTAEAAILSEAADSLPSEALSDDLANEWFDDEDEDER